MSDPPRPIPTDHEIDQAINLYEQRHRLMLSPDQRSTLRIMARQQPTSPRLPTHPLGGQMRPDDDRHSPGNRAQVKAALYLYFDNGQPVTLDNGQCVRAPYRGTPLLLQEDDVGGALADQLNQRRDAATGLELADRVVSRFELGRAVMMQWRTAKKEAQLLERRYLKLESIEQICAALHIEKRAYHNRITEAVDTLIDAIYISDFTEAKSSDMALECSDS